MPDSETETDTTSDTTDRDSFADDLADGANASADYYAVLGIRRDASHDDVRHAYHRLAKLWHPDRYMDAPPALRERAERRTRALNAAYAVLSDPAKRAAYDGHGVSHAVLVQRRPAPHGASRDAPHADWPITRPAPEPGNDGTGIFFGAIFGIIALMLFLVALNSLVVIIGRYIALGGAMLATGIAFWCVTQGALLARLANQVLASSPPPRSEHASERPYRAATAHASDHHHAHGHPEHAAPADDFADDVADADEHGERETVPADNPHDEADAAFEKLVDEAVAGIPAEFRSYLHNVVVRVKRNPSAHDIAELSIRERGLLLGLYQGVDLTRQHIQGAPVPEVITIFRRPIEHYCQHDPDRIREQVRRTVLHELAHHFGIDHDDMPDWIR